MNKTTLIAFIFLLEMALPSLEARRSTAVSTFVSYTEGDGIGYEGGYASAEVLLFPSRFCKNRCYWSFFDVQAHVFNNGELAANAGLGIRFIPPHSFMIVGLNAFYDFRESFNDFDYHQFGFGFELLSCPLDIRVNAYIPFDNERVIETCYFEYTQGYFMEKKEVEVAFPGASIEFGTCLPSPRCLNTYAALGAYVYKEDISRTAFGGSFRFTTSLNNWLYIEADLSYDPLFEFRANGTVGIRFGFGGPFKRCSNKACCLPYQPIYRNQMIVLENFCKWDYNF